MENARPPYVLDFMAGVPNIANGMTILELLMDDNP